MTDNEALKTAVEDLIEIVRLQAQELHRVATHLEQQTTPMPSPQQAPLILSELSELHRRVRNLAAAGAAR